MRLARTPLLLAAVILCSCTKTVVLERPSEVPPSASSAPASVPPAPVPPGSPSATSSPRALRIDVPFYVQAPFRNWDALHEETCEEASLLMVQRYLAGLPPLSEQDSERELQHIVQWQNDRGLPWDIGVDDLLRTARELYGLNGRVEEDVSQSRIRELLAQGLPVIVPAAGRQLGNQYFSGEGPWYHMLVITGYDGDTAITNDPGTRRGEGFRYPFPTLLNAIHDWTGVKEDIEKGPKRILILWK